MKNLPPWRPKPFKKLGNGATLVEEASHFIHDLGNKLMVLMMRMEMRSASSKARVAARAEERRRIAKSLKALRARHRTKRRALK